LILTHNCWNNDEIYMFILSLVNINTIYPIYNNFLLKKNLEWIVFLFSIWVDSNVPAKAKFPMISIILMYQFLLLFRASWNDKLKYLCSNSGHISYLSYLFLLYSPMPVNQFQELTTVHHHYIVVSAVDSVGAVNAESLRIQRCTVVFFPEDQGSSCSPDTSSSLTPSLIHSVHSNNL